MNSEMQTRKDITVDGTTKMIRYMNSEMQTRKDITVDGTTKMIRYMNGQFFDEGIMFSSNCDAEIFGIACPVRDRIQVENRTYY